MIMKKSIQIIAIAVLSLAACNKNDHRTSKGQKSNEDTLVQQPDKTSISVSNPKNGTSVKDIVNLYLQMKNALAEDNSSEAAIAGKALEDSLHNFNKASFSDSEKKTFNNISETAVENAEHIGKNSGNIAHQREHFEMLSQDIYDLVKAFGDGQILYDFFCPMYNNGKGASWLSETKEIKNPYMGKSMPTCGTLKEEIK
jgi:hypothetical protein